MPGVLRSVPITALIGVFTLLLAACAPATQPGATSAPSQPATITAPAKAEATPAAATVPDEQAIAQFYRGKTVRIIVGFAAGGGFDLYSRLLAKYLPRYIPGNPTVIVENMPGASSLLAMNHVSNAAPKDGTVIGNIIGSLALQQLFGADGVEFDMARTNYIGMPVSGTLVMTVVSSAGVSSIEETLGPSGKEVVVGTTAPGAGNHDGAVLVKEVLGANLRIVPGYGGTSQIRLAMDNGEVQAIFNPWESTKQTSLEKVQSGEWLLLTQFLETPHKELPEVPSVLSFAQNDEQRQLLLYGGVIPNQFEKVYVMAPEAPGDRVAAMQEAFLEALSDPALLAEAEQAKQDIAPVPGEVVRQRITDFMSMPTVLRDKLKQVMLPS